MIVEPFISDSIKPTQSAFQRSSNGTITAVTTLHWDAPITGKEQGVFVNWKQALPKQASLWDPLGTVVRCIKLYVIFQAVCFCCTGAD